jgi:predicted SprT family Zn-dependent metalloprotease
MKTDNEVLEEARQWVKGINKHFKINKPIVVVKTKKKTDNYAETTLENGKVIPFVIAVNTKYFRRNKTKYSLFEIMFHEMTHILLWPITKDHSKCLDQEEENIVWKLQSLFKKISERQ